MPKEINIIELTKSRPEICGIAHYAGDLGNALGKLNISGNEKLKRAVIAVTENPHINFGGKVIAKIKKNCIEDYIQLAENINHSKVSLVSAQFENGIYGGSLGHYFFYFAEIIKSKKIPLVTTLHTVIPKDDYNDNGLNRREVTQKVLTLSDKIVVISHAAEETLRKEYKLGENQLHVIHHGIHPLEGMENLENETTTQRARKILGMEFGKPALGVVGIVRRDRCIENAIEVLYQVVQDYPNASLVIAGKTHPGETEIVDGKIREPYREELENLVKTKGLERNVLWVNENLSSVKMAHYIAALDFNITLYGINAINQVSSGMLSQALASGTPTISTAFSYACEIASGSDGAVILIDYDTQEKMCKRASKAIKSILHSPKRLQTMSEHARKFAEHMYWPNVAEKYLEIFKEVVR